MDNRLDVTHKNRVKDFSRTRFSWNVRVEVGRKIARFFSQLSYNTVVFTILHLAVGQNFHVRGFPVPLSQCYLIENGSQVQLDKNSRIDYSRARDILQFGRTSFAETQRKSVGLASFTFAWRRFVGEAFPSPHPRFNRRLINPQATPSLVRVDLSRCVV